MSAPAGLPQSTVEVLASVSQHRVLTTAQIRTIHFPERSPRRAQQVMASLEAAGLIAHVQAPGALPRRLWFVTGAGNTAIRASGVLDEPPKELDEGQAAGQLSAHTIAVNDVGVAFLEAARGRGDEFGALSWQHEVSHPLNLGRRRRRFLRADATITYLRADGDEIYVEQRFIEVDRATLSIDRLAAELATYAELFRASDDQGGPLWRRRYPAFPPILCVLSGARAATLERRRDAVIALLNSDPNLSRTPEVAISICMAEELTKRGPFERIFRGPGRGRERFNWLGHPGTSRKRKGRHESPA